MSLENLSEEELQDIAENITEEEFDQLDELSKKTLLNYAQEAGRSANTAYANKEMHDTSSKSWKSGSEKFGVDSATKKFFRKISKQEKKFSDKEGNNIRKRGKGLQMVGKKLTREEFDQLDELSKKTLGNYIRASADAHANHSLDGEAADTYGDDWEEHEHKEKNRLKGINRALKRFPGKEKTKDKILKNTKGLSRNKSDLFHDRDGPSNTNEPYHYNHTAERDYENYDTEHSRRKIDKNVSKLTKEEFDQLDELSDKTLASYIKKADKQKPKLWQKVRGKEKVVRDFSIAKDAIKSVDGPRGKAYYMIDKAQEKHDNDRKKLYKKVSKREYGTYRAGKKLTREDISDLISTAIDKRPINFAEKFNDILVDKIEEAIEYKKYQVAESLYGTPDDYNNLYLEDIDIDLDLEEFDQLDELSKKTLGSYIRKAADSHANRSLDGDAADMYGDDYRNHDHKANNRLKGIKKALKRFPGQEKTKNKILKNTKRLAGNKSNMFHDRDGPSNTEDEYHYNHTAERDYEDYNTRKNRDKIDKATSKLTREDFDLQELARETMTSDLIKKGHKESDLKKMKYSEVRDRYMNHDYNNSK